MIPLAVPDLSGNELKYVTDCIESSWISSAGSYVTKFEEKFADFVNTKYASSCSNGTAALHLALLAINVGPDDEVIVPNLTFASTAAVVKQCGAKPVLVDVDKETWNIDPELLKDAITDKTKAIIPVHLMGNPCDMDTIISIAKANKLIVIEDAAEAHGAEYEGRTVGSIGHIGCFSFYGNKIMTTGEGGMCVTNDKELFDKINLLKNHGMEKKYWHDVVGFNYRITNLQAAIGVAQLERIEEFVSKRKELLKAYQENIKLSFQKVTKNSEAAPWFFVALVDDRDIVAEKIKNEVETRPMFYPLNEMEPYKNNGSFPNSKEISSKGLILPLHPGMNADDVKKICSLLRTK